ncbi:MAG: tetratricopeptide repeat protein [Saprospiraceae bacterium]|nr:tetratricopeptide repeat protein [Saprospiraceae bacterium]
MRLLFLILLLCPATLLYNQAGIYSESDIELQSLFIDAELEKQKGNHEAQIEILKSILKRDKSQHAVYFELAKAYVSKDDLEQAEKYIKKAIQLEDSNPWYWLFAAQIYEDAALYPDAVIAYSRLVELDSKNKSNHLRLALNHLNLGNWNAAANTLIAWQSEYGIDEETSKRLFDIYLAANEEANALKVLEALSESKPQNTRYLNNLAGYLSDIGQNDRAQEIYKRVLEIDPTNPAASMAIVRKSTGPDDAGDYLSSLMPVMKNPNIPLDNKIRELMPYIARMSTNSASNNSLIEISTALVDVYPQEAKVYAVQGDILFYSGQFIEAEKAYAESINLNDRQFILWDQWMLSLWETENYVKLEEVSFNAVDLFPNELNAYILRVMSLMKLNQIDEAKEYLEEANFIGANSQRFRVPLLILNNWVNKASTQATKLKSLVEHIEIGSISQAIYIEMLGDIYKFIGENKMANDFWQLAIDRGAQSSRINKKMGV